MEQPNARSCYALSIVSTKGSTIERNARTNQQDSENTSCDVSASPGHAQRFLSAFGPIFDHFHPKRHRLTARDYRALMQDRFLVWCKVTGGKVAAWHHILLSSPPLFPPLLSFPQKSLPFLRQVDNTCCRADATKRQPNDFSGSFSKRKPL